MRLSIDAYERMAGEILKVYEQAELEMTRRVAKRLEKGVTQPGWTEQKYGEMKAVTKQMTKVVDSLHRDVNVQVQQYVETGYEDGKGSFINEAREFTDISQIRELTPNAVKVANIMGDLDMSLSAADRLILRQVNDSYANIIAQTSALVATGSFTNKQAVQIALNRFADKGISSFIDRAGRRWEMTTYAEMATLTAIERATRQGYTDTMQEFGFDLAIISSHYGACPLCEAWENVIISISGKDTRYPSLADAEAGGCFHPRCMHVFSTYYEGITKGGRKGPRTIESPNIGYSARAQQRAYERQERRWKRRMAVAQSPEEERAAYARVRMYQDKIRRLIADYNSTVDPSVDYLPRKYDREGGRVKLSDAAKKLKPVVIPQGQAKVAMSAVNFQLIGGNNDPEVTNNMHDFFLPQKTRQKIDRIEKIKTYSQAKQFFEAEYGIKLSTKIESLETSRRDDEIEAVSGMVQNIAIAVDAYKETFGDKALSKLHEIVLYDRDLDTQAGYYFNRLGEHDPLAGQIHFRRWDKDGYPIFHELAHALQDSFAGTNEDAVLFSERVLKALDAEDLKAYFGASSEDQAAEQMADAIGYGFSRGEERDMDFILKLRHFLRRIS